MQTKTLAKQPFNASDFARLHGEYLTSGQSHHGIIIMTDQTRSVGEKIKRLATLLSAVSAHEMMNRIQFL